MVVDSLRRTHVIAKIKNNEKGDLTCVVDVFECHWSCLQSPIRWNMMCPGARFMKRSILTPGFSVFHACEKGIVTGQVVGIRVGSNLKLERLNVEPVLNCRSDKLIWRRMA